MMMVEEGGFEGRGKVCGIIDKATNSTAPEVDPRLLKHIKSLVRDSESELRLSVQSLMSLMKRDHSQVRYLALLIIDELFMRSKLFRTLLVVNLDQLLTLSVGFRRNMPLPAPPAVASLLRSKAIEFLEKWNTSFGIHYRHLRLGYNYLKNNLRFQFPNLQANAARIQRERREREKRSKEILQRKFGMLKENLTSIKDEIQLSIEEIQECLEIISTRDEDAPVHPMEDSEFEEFQSSELRRIRLDSLKEGERVHENADNKVVFDALRESYKLLVTKHLASVHEWISVLIRVEVVDDRFRDSALKELIDIQNRLYSVKKKCEESGCAVPKPTNDEEDDDIWVEGNIEPLTERANEQADDHAIASTPVVVNETCDRQSGEHNTNSIKGKLLAEAPVVRWGLFLDSWGLNRDVPANQRGLELDSHWGRVDYDAVISAEKIAELNVQTTLYTEEPVDIQPCRAPLGKGGLCQRKDLKVCPFHGLVIPRDNEGKPINDKAPVDCSLVEKVAKQAVKNVRERDKEEGRRREQDKRAKLAMVREHNDLVLRDAAMASSSMWDVGETCLMKQKKQSLASMVQKKVTSKDRLAQRLSSTRARAETARQMTMGEDSKYREAFPNQW